MYIQHKILSFDDRAGSILVEYFCDELPEGFIYSIDLPIENNQFPTQEQIENLINHFKPVSQIERMINIKNIFVPEYLSKLIPIISNPEPIIDNSQPIIVGTNPLPL